MKILPPALAPLARLPHWCIWRYVQDPDGKPKKVPYQSRHPDRYAKTNDPKTWSSYEEALAVAPRADGIGFMLLGSGIGALDLDDCRDPNSGKLDDWARDLIAKANGAYVEVTPSGRGLRIIGLTRGQTVHTFRRMGRGKVEAYRDTARYICVTGQKLKK